jgi:hypothetical protein
LYGVAFDSSVLAAFGALGFPDGPGRSFVIPSCFIINRWSSRVNLSMRNLSSLDTCPKTWTAKKMLKEKIRIDFFIITPFLSIHRFYTIK